MLLKSTDSSAMGCKSGLVNDLIESSKDMSTGNCVFCGSMKRGAFTPCSSCNKIPISENDLMDSTACSSRFLPLDVLQRLSAEMRRGRPRPVLLPQDQALMRSIARKWMKNPAYGIATRISSGRVTTVKPKAIREFGLLHGLLFAYLAVGSILGVILWGSFIYSQTWDSSRLHPDMNFAKRSVLFVMSQPFALAYEAFRTVFWGPSLIIWATEGEPDYSFIEWLAPGLYSAADKNR